MLYITQLVYVKEGAQEMFHQFEDQAIPLIYKYNGSLLLRVRPDPKAVVAADIDPPYEIHLVSFESETDFQAFLSDEVRKQFLHLKEQSIQSAILFKGEKL